MLLGGGEPHDVNRNRHVYSKRNVFAAQDAPLCRCEISFDLLVRKVMQLHRRQLTPQPLYYPMYRVMHRWMFPHMRTHPDRPHKKDDAHDEYKTNFPA